MPGMSGFEVLSALEADEGQPQQDVDARRSVSDRIRDEVQRARMAEAGKQAGYKLAESFRRLTWG